MPQNDDNRNYRGRFEGEFWGEDDSKLKHQRSSNMKWTAYNKFYIAIAGFVISAITSLTGIDFALFGLTPEALVSAVTAILVWVIPAPGYVKPA